VPVPARWACQPSSQPQWSAAWRSTWQGSARHCCQYCTDRGPRPCVTLQQVRRTVMVVVVGVHVYAQHLLVCVDRHISETITRVCLQQLHERYLGATCACLCAPAELGTSGFRQELLQAAADEAAAQAAKKSSSSASTGGTSAAAGGGDRGPGSRREISDSGEPPVGSGVSFSAASASLRDLLKYGAGLLCVILHIANENMSFCRCRAAVVFCLNPELSVLSLGHTILAYTVPPVHLLVRKKCFVCARQVLGSSIRCPNEVFLLAVCRRPSQTDKLPRQLAAAAEAAAAAQQQRESLLHRQQQDHWQQQQQLPEEPGADGVDLEDLYPGESEKAVRELIDRGDRRNTGVCWCLSICKPMCMTSSACACVCGPVWACCVRTCKPAAPVCSVMQWRQSCLGACVAVV
jgi:hypothetical protein